MFNRKMDIAIIILLILAVAMSAYSIFISSPIDETSEPSNSMSSTVELICWNDEKSKAYGTGFITNHDGTYVITNCHMVMKNLTNNEPFDQIKAKFANTSTEYDLTLISFDKDNDIAALKFKDYDPKCGLNFRTERPTYGEDIYVIGNALGYGLSIKKGVISVPEINIINNGVTKNCVMISITINHGDSGSPIIDSKGNVVGMSSFKLKDDGKTIDGMSYGITSKTIVNFIDNCNH